MRKYIFSLLICLMLASVLVAQSSDKAIGLNKNQVDLIHKTLKKLPDRTEFAIALVHGDEVIHYGITKEDGELKEIENKDHIFQIGSVSKVFTTQLLVHMVNEGSIKSLDEAVADMLPVKMKGNPVFTFRQLASHSSGLPSDPGNLNTTIFTAKNPYKKYSEENLIKFLTEDLRMEASPGSRYNYSNLGMTLLGFSLTQISGKTYEHLLQQEIFGPLGMENSSTEKGSLKKIFVQGLNKNGNPVPYWDFQVAAPAGAILSTTEDLTKYVQGNFKALENELASMKKTQVLVDEKMDVALGWHIIKNHSPQPFLWHNGGTGGFKSSLGLRLEDKKGVILLTNVGRGPMRKEIDLLCYKLMASD